jgi:hypothetical protein
MMPARLWLLTVVAVAVLVALAVAAVLLTSSPS